jgi:hypothetical protein
MTADLTPEKKPSEDFKTLHRLFHTLWTKAVGEIGYEKAQWKLLERTIDELWYKAHGKGPTLVEEPAATPASIPPSSTQWSHLRTDPKARGMKTNHVIGGGTVFHVRPHLALSAPAYGATARQIHRYLENVLPTDINLLHLTRMAGGQTLETNEDIAKLVGSIVADKETGIVFMSAALCDFEGHIEDFSPHIHESASGKDQPRLRTDEGKHTMLLHPADKIIGRIRKERKDIFLVGFKTTAGASAHEQYEAGLLLLKKNACNLVLANDVHTRLNMVIAPELARYYETTDRDAALRGLLDMTIKRSQLSFSRTTVVVNTAQDGDVPLLEWDDPMVPISLRMVVDHCVTRGAYRPFNNVTVGHFAFRSLSQSNRLYSSRRKRNYNLPGEKDLVAVDSNGEVIAHGAKPSAGTRSQWAVLQAFPEYDCIVHFHCPLKAGSEVTVRPQHDFECGSHECGENTVAGIRRFVERRIGAVMLDKHGPNIIFHRHLDPQLVIDFIEKNFDITKRSDDA